MMKKLAAIFVLTSVLFSTSAFSQDNDYIQAPTLGVHFFYNDFTTAAYIRSSSLASAFKDNQFGKIKGMNGGFAVNYIQGLTSKLDFTSTLALSSVDYPLRNHDPVGTEAVLYEADASIRAKMFSNKYVVVPYVQAGIGASQWNGYYGAFIPAGLGLQFNVGDEGHILVNSQYRIPITETSNYHFFYSLGFAGRIGSLKAK